MSYAALTKWSLYPNRLPELFFPEFSGRVGTINWAQQYWGSQVFSERVPLILSIYVGCVCSALTIIGGLHKGHNPILLRRVRMFLLCILPCSLLLSLGRFSPFSYFLYRYIPFMTLFRFPVKFLSAGILPLALLVGYASDVHFGGLRAPSLKFLGILWGISGVLILFTIIFWLSEDFASRFQEFFFQQSHEVMFRGIRTSLIHVSAIWLLLTLLYQYRRLRSGRWQQWLLASILLVDLLSAGKRINHYAPEEFFTDIPDAVRLVRRELGDGRLFRTANPSAQFNPSLPDDIMWMYRWTFEILDSSFASLFRLPVIFHIDFDKLAQVYIAHLTTLIDSVSWDRRLPVLSAGGVTLIITSDDVSLPDMERIGEIPNWSNVRFYLYRNKTAAARVGFVTRWKKVASDADALGSMLHPNYDPRKFVILQQPESLLSLLFSRRQIQDDLLPIPINTEQTLEAHDTEVNLNTCTVPQIDTLKSAPNFSRFVVSNDCDGYLVFSEPFYPGWHIYVDGNPTSMLRANYAFSAIFLQAGQHEVKRVYRPASLILGMLCSLLFCLVLGVVTYKGWFLRIQKNSKKCMTNVT
jgi:hypothetical protein